MHLLALLCLMGAYDYSELVCAAEEPASEPVCEAYTEYYTDSPYWKDSCHE